MPTVEDIHTQIFSQCIRPMRPFAGNERIHAFRRSLFEIAPCATAHDADSAANWRAARN